MTTHTVLIVDDSPDEIEITKRLLSRTGPPLQILSVRGGEEAIALLLGMENLPSLLLLDLKMPGMNGIETLRKIRDEARLKNLPVAILTNSSLQSDRDEAIAAGANSFLSKSIDTDEFWKELRLLVEKWLKK